MLRPPRMLSVILKKHNLIPLQRGYIGYGTLINVDLGYSREETKEIFHRIVSNSK